MKPWIMVSPGHSGERTEVRLVDDQRTLGIRYVAAEITTPEGEAALRAAVDELRAEHGAAG